MQEVVHARDVARARLLLGAALLLLVADRAAKLLAVRGGAVRFAPGVEFALFRNEGIAFGVPVPAMAFWLVAVPVFLALAALGVSRLRARDHVGAALTALVLLGAASNLADRAATGAITDYLILGRSAVNIADGMILGGVLALVLRKPREEKTRPS